MLISRLWTHSIVNGTGIYFMQRNYSTMDGMMARSAKPYNIQRFRIILMVCLGFFLTAIYAWQSFYFSSSYSAINDIPCFRFIFVPFPCGQIFLRIIFNPFFSAIFYNFFINKIVSTALFADIVLVFFLIFFHGFKIVGSMFPIINSRISCITFPANISIISKLHNFFFGRTSSAYFHNSIIT